MKDKIIKIFINLIILYFHLKIRMYAKKIILLLISMIILNIIIGNKYVDGLRLNSGLSNTEVEWVSLQEYSNTKLLSAEPWRAWILPSLRTSSISTNPESGATGADKKNNIAQEVKRGFIRRSFYYGVMLCLIIFF